MPTFPIDLLAKVAGQLGIVGVILGICWYGFSFLIRMFEKQREDYAKQIEQQREAYVKQIEQMEDDIANQRKEMNERTKEYHEKFERIVGDLKSIITTNTGAMVELKGMINNLSEAIRIK